MDAQMQPLRRRPGRTVAASLAVFGLLTACTSGGESAEPEESETTTVTTETVEDESTATSSASAASDDTMTDDPEETATEATEAGSDADDGSGDAATTTTTVATAAEETTTTPKPTVQAQDSALACAQVEIGYLRLLNDGSGTEDLLEGATSAQATGAATYIELGAALEAALGSDAAADAADALLTQCEADGYERLA